MLLYGIGDLLAMPNWHKVCDEILTTGIPLRVVTNLSKRLKPDEAATLVQFSYINVSMDTADPVMHSSIRRGSSLEVVLKNLRILAESAERHGTSPNLAFNTVVADKTVFGLKELIELGVSYGVKEFFLNDLIGEGHSERISVRHVSTLPHSDLARALTVIEQAREYARQVDVTVHIQGGIVARMQEVLSGNSSSVPSDPEAGGWGGATLPPGYTRNCIDPWAYALISTDGRVAPCCAFDSELGNLSEGSLNDVLNNARMRDLRRQLIEGDLTKCARCSAHLPISIEEFRKLVRDHLLANEPGFIPPEGSSTDDRTD